MLRTVGEVIGAGFSAGVDLARKSINLLIGLVETGMNFIFTPYRAAAGFLNKIPGVGGAIPDFVTKPLKLPRLHSGGVMGGGEGLAILQAGERVIPRGGSGPATGGGGPTTIIVQLGDREIGRVVADALRQNRLDRGDMTRVRTDNVFGTITRQPVDQRRDDAELAPVSPTSPPCRPPRRSSSSTPTGSPAPPKSSLSPPTPAPPRRPRSTGPVRHRRPPAPPRHRMGPRPHRQSNATSYVTAADDQGDYVPMNAWEAYVPTLTQSATVTKTVTYANFIRVGRMVNVVVNLAVTGTGTAANNVVVGLPVAAATAAVNSPIGMAMLFDTSAGGFYRAVLELNTTTACILRGVTTTGVDALGTTTFTAALASGDSVRFFATYEAAT